MLGGLETGGTWCVAAVGTGPGDLVALERFPTTTPAATIARCVELFAARGPLRRLGVGSFGPVDVDPGSPTWGHLLSTPKPGWRGTALGPELAARLGVEVVIDTDVNAAALAEWRWGAGRGVDPFAYLTVGTGVGAGVLVGGRPVHGLMHPELGHLRVPRDHARDPFPGVCPYHGDCLEGLASGPALAARWGRPASELPDDHDAWALEAEYIAQALYALACVLSPPRVVLSGGVGRRPPLRELVGERLGELAGGYLPVPAVVAPALDDRAGVLGALALAGDGAP